MSSSHLSFLVLTLSLSACGPAPEMPEYKSSSTRLMDVTDEKNFYKLPLKAEIKNGQKFWSGDYWALNLGNINYRWNSPLRESFDYSSPTRDELIFMLPAQIAELAPSEKYDLLLGRYDYPLKKEVYTHANRRAADWEGICNGWSPASMNHNEPKPKVLKNPDGISIPFGSSDIKALVSYYYAYIHQVQDTQQIGRRCPRGSRWFNWDRDCKNDLDAGSFHVVLTNKAGKRNQSFMVDIERYKEVWNHPVVGYETTILGEREPERDEMEEARKVIKVQTKVRYVNGSRENTWTPVRGTPHQRTTTRNYSYNLFLNERDEIIGGEWKSGDRPDFLWTMGAAPKFQGLLKGLEKLLND